MDIGTGGAFDVPSLNGAAFRAPYLHDGCASGLADVFASCASSSAHAGFLSAARVGDLIAYLRTL